MCCLAKRVGLRVAGAVSPGVPAVGFPPDAVSLSWQLAATGCNSSWKWPYGQRQVP